MKKRKKKLILSMGRIIGWIGLLVVFVGMLTIGVWCLIHFDYFPASTENRITAKHPDSSSFQGELWTAPDTSSIPLTPEGDLIRYGHELIAHTAVYLGPKGSVQQISNGMNCQNCHPAGGTVPYGNNFARVTVSFPQFRNRSGTTESLEKRVNDCLERSLNGQPLDTNSLEMKAMVAYMKWVGQGVKSETSLKGLGLIPLQPLEIAADPIKGQAVFRNHCVRCHGEQGEGQMAASGMEWEYPPIFGENSYNTAAGLYRLSTFASYVKHNMPFGVTFDAPLLSDEEAWNVAAYVNSMPRPEKHFPEDWPDISKKPIDHPFGPFTDSFPESQHKFGPFDPILKVREAKKSGK